MDVAPTHQPLSPIQARRLTGDASFTGALDPQQLALAVGGVVMILDADGRIIDAAAANPAWLDESRAELVGRTLFDYLTAELAEQRAGLVRRALESQQAVTFEYSRQAAGANYWFHTTITPLSPREALWVARDVTDQRLLESLSELQRNILELIATGAPLQGVLTALAQFTESRVEGTLCSILRLDADGQHLRHAVAPSLPAEYTQAIDGLAIGPKAGSCGTAAFRGEPVIVEDIDLDPLWDDYRALARQFNLRACWSRPIPATDGRILGTFALYYGEPRAPRPNELELIETAAYLASIAMERDLAEETLRQAERAEREKAAVLEAVRQASLGLTKSLEFPAILDDVLGAVYGLMAGARNAHIYLYEAQADKLSFGAAVRADGLTKPWVTPRPDGLTHTVARTGQAVVIADMNTHPLYAQAPSHWGGAIVGIPLKNGQRVVGVMSVAYDQPRSFSDSELRQLDLLADQAASAVENARLFQAERVAREHAEALREAAAALLTPGLERGQVLQLILEQLARVVDYHSASIMLTEAGALVLAAHRGLRVEVQAQISTLQLRSMEHVREVLDKRVPVIIPDTERDTRWQPMSDPKANYIRCWLGVPLLSMERVIGVLNVDRETPGFFTEAHGRLASAFANQAALAIEQTRLYEHFARETDRLRLLSQLGRDLSARLDPEQVYAAIHRATVRLMPCDAFIIALTTEPGTEVRVVYLIDKGARWPVATLPADRGLSAMVLKSGQPLRVDNLEQFEALEPVRLGDPEHVRSLVIVPMFLGEKVIGVLSAQSYAEHSYSDLEEQTLSTLAYQAAIAIENARLYAETRDQLRDQRLLFECGQALAVAHDTTAVFNIVAEKIVARFEATALTYYSFDENNLASRVDFEYWSELSSEIERRSVAGQVADLTNFPLTLQALRTRSPRSIHRGQSSLTSDERDSLEAFGGQSIITVPMALHDRALGFFEIWNSRYDYVYTDGDQSLLQALATQTAIAVENVRLFAETRRQSSELETLLDAARAVSSTLRLEQIMAVIARKMAETTNAVGCTISRWDPEQDAVVTWVTWRQRQMDHEDVPGTVYPLAQYPATRDVLLHKRRRLISVADTLADPTELEVMRRARVSSLLMVPLIIGNRVIGLVEVFEDSLARKFAADEIELIQGMTNQAAIAIANAKLFEELNQEKRRLELLYGLSQNLTTSLDPYEVGQRALDQMCQAFEAFQGAIYVVEPATDRIRLVALTDADHRRIEQLDRRMDFHVGYGLTGWVAQRREALVIDDVLADPHWVPIPELDERVRSLIAAPLVAGNNLVGVINLSGDRPAGFRPDQIPLFSAAATQVAAALHNARLFNATRRQADEVQVATSILHALNASADVTQAFSVIASGLRQLTGCERVSLALLDEPHENVTIAALDQPRPEPDRGATFPVSLTAAAADVLAGRLHLTPSLAAEMDYPAERSLFASGHRSRINVPLRIGTRVLGALNLVWQHETGYQNTNLDLMNQIADALALAIEKNRFFEEGRRRDAILESLAYGGQKLLMPGNLPENLMDALGNLGQVIGVSRAYVFENHFADSGDLVTSELYEWCAPGAQSQLANSALQNMPYSGRLERWRRILSEGSPLYGLARDMPGPEQALLGSLGVRSLALVPIFSAGNWWGFLGFDDCDLDRRWTVAEIESLKNAAATVGTAFARQASEIAEREQRVLAEALRDTASVLNSTLNIDEVLDRILESVGRVVPHDAATVTMIDGRSQTSYAVRRSGFRLADDRPAQTLRMPLGSAPNLRQMLADRRPVIIPDTRNYAGWVELPETRWVRSYLGAPIVVRNEVIGFVNLDSLTPGFFTVRHAEHLQAFANEAALAIQNAQLFETTEWHVRSVTLLNEITQAALAATDYVSSLKLLADKLGQLVGADGCYIALWDEIRQRSIPTVAYYGLHRDQHMADSRSLQQEDTLTGSVLALGRTLVVEDIHESDYIGPRLIGVFETYSVRSLLALPLIVGDRRLGAVMMMYGEAHHFAPEEIASSEQAAGQVALAIFKGKLLESERQQRVLAESLRDTAGALNSTLNFNEVLDQILANVGRVVPHDTASIMLAEDPSRAIDPVSGIVKIVRARGFAERGLESWVLGRRFQVSESAKIQRMLTARQPLVIDDLQGDPDWLTLPESDWVHSHLAAPIGLRGWIIGFINLDSAIPHFFNDVHAERLRVFADQAAVAIENAYLYDSIRQNADELSFLYRASAEMIKPGMQLEDLATHIASVLSLEVRTAYCGVWLVDDSAAGLRRIAESGATSRPRSDTTPLNGPGLIAAVARSSQPVYVPASEAGEPALAALPAELHSTLTVPLTGGGRVIGVLHVEDRAADAFDERKRRIISAFAERAGLALENTQLVARLDLARRMAEEASQLKSEFLANTSHELRTPLTGIIGSLSMVLDDMCDSEAEQREFIQIAYTASEHLLDLINKVLDIAKIESGRLEIELRPLALAPILGELYALSKVQTDDKNLLFELHASDDLLSVVGEPDKLRQIMLNLIGNAIKFTDRGSIRIDVAAVDNHWVQIAVRDTGIGIPPEKQAKLFQPFVQVDGSMTRKYGGTGLGLSISRRLAEMMGATLTLHSEGLDRGTTLLLRLPRVVKGLCE